MEPTGAPQAGRSYDAGAATPLPELLDIHGVDRVESPGDTQLDAVYFDTQTLALATRRIVLRRRTGGIDHGWQLDIPAGTAARQEINAPLGQPDSVPKELLTHVLAYTRGENLVPIVRLGTKRSTYRLYGAEGGHLADFADDRIHAEVMHPPGSAMEWREWKVLLVHGANELLVAADETLAATGATNSGLGSELARALGGAYPPAHSTGTARPRKKGPAIDVVSAYLDVHIGNLLANDPGVRLGQPEAVHEMRSATRRIRSALSTYAPLLQAGTAGMLGELKWLARILGRPRDAEVMRERLRGRISELPKPLRAGPVWEPIERELGTAYNVDFRELLKALESDRYFKLLDSLEELRDHPPTTARASRPARREAAGLVNKDAKRLGRAQKFAARTKSGGARDAALHQARKDAKRLLHAAESVSAIHGKPARKLGRHAHRLQRTLGNHQDSVMVRGLLEDLASDPALPEETARAYRRIRDIEKDIARAAVKKYAKARGKLSKLRLRH